MWFWNFRPNVAPFAGLMLKGYKKRGPLEGVPDESDESATHEAMTRAANGQALTDTLPPKGRAS